MLGKRLSWWVVEMGERYDGIYGLSIPSLSDGHVDQDYCTWGKEEVK